MCGNPLNTTPYFNELCKQGVFFKNCFSPAYGTARGVWAIITGIPDVTTNKTASRNPNLVDQQTVLNDIKGYEKFYFIGGSASWANIRGLLTGNINNLHLYEQEDYRSAKVDVWGISDKNLFLEASRILKKETTPFYFCKKLPLLKIKQLHFLPLFKRPIIIGPIQFQKKINHLLIKENFQKIH
jgi:phosphoglycerol transferase MdoB-like AlkP superfamily enzyme